MINRRGGGRDAAAAAAAAVQHLTRHPKAGPLD
jgi:hypothetical protein